jgi:hypothetical protein
MGGKMDNEHRKERHADEGSISPASLNEPSEMLPSSA